MLESLLTGVLHQRLLVGLVFGLCILGGIGAFQSLPIDAFPDLTNVQVQIITEAPGLAPLETEQLVTIPLEAITQGLPKVEEVRSLTKFGLSVVTVVFQDDVNIYFARQLVNERLQSARNRLPMSVDSQLGPIATGMGEIYQYVVEGPGYTSTDLKTLHDWTIKYQLRTVPGVNEVNTWGGQTRAYTVTLHPEQLSRYHLTLNDVFTALQENNAYFSGGIIEHGPEQYTVRGLGRVNSLADIEAILIRREDGVPIRIAQVASVGYGHSLRQGAVTKDGKGEVVTGLVMMLKGENSREVIHRVKEKVRQIQSGLPLGVRLTPFYDQTHLVEQTFHTVQTNLLEGGLLVIGVLLLLLGNAWAALIVASVIPISLMFSFMGMKLTGITANLMSLGAVDFGMIVDGAIVLTEDTVRRLSSSSAEPQANRVMTAVQASLRDMARPILFGVLIIAVVYMPVLSLQGLEYKLFSPMVFTVCFALLGSLLTALILVPMLCGMFLKANPQADWENPVIPWVRRPYLALLQQAMRHPRWTIATALIIAVGTLVLVPLLGTEFVPQLDEGDIVIETRTIPSISLSEESRLTTHMERSLRDIPEVHTIVSKAGRPDLATDPMGVYAADMYVMLKPRDQWRGGVDKSWLMNEMNRRLTRDAPGVRFNFTQPIAMRVNELVSGVRADLGIKLYGDDFNQLTRTAGEIEQVIRQIPGEQDVQVEKPVGNAQLVLTPNRSAMARYGVSIADLRNLLEVAVNGKPVTEVYEGCKRFALLVCLPDVNQLNPDSLADLLVETAGGQRVPLGLVAHVERRTGLEVINREAGQRRVIIQCNVQGRDLGSFVQEAQARVAKAVRLPKGYSLVWGGQFENQQRAMARLAWVVPLSVLVIFVLLLATFSAVQPALLVLLNVPFALVGGVLALLLRGMYLNVPAAIGFITLFGVAVLNGLVLLSTINRLVQAGQATSQAVLHAAETRFRPVLMTALVATLGFLPMALSQGAGAEIQRPLATVVIGGLISSTLLTLLVLPVVYNWLKQRNTQKS